MSFKIRIVDRNTKNVVVSYDSPAIPEIGDAVVYDSLRVVTGRVFIIGREGPIDPDGAYLGKPYLDSINVLVEE